MKQLLSIALSVLLIACVACMPFSNAPSAVGTPAAVATPVETAPDVPNETPSAQPVAEVVQSVSGVVVSAENGNVAIRPLPSEALAMSADLIAFESDTIADSGAKRGDIVQVVYTGEAQEIYPVHIQATSWSVLISTAPLYQLLADLSASVFPGTAGCSLTAAKFAGMLLDYEAEAAVPATAVTAVAAAYISSLDESSAALFFEQLALVLDAGAALVTDTGRALLDSAGYQPTAYPYDAPAANAFLAALGSAATPS